jgi:large subunit ribosomal protein L21
MYAVIEESGGQRRITEGDQFLIDLAEGGEAKAGSTITFDKVLVVGEAGGGAKLGTPYVKGASVTVEVVDPAVLGDKIHIYKFSEKKTYKNKTGHRQRYTAVKVTGIKG